VRGDRGEVGGGRVVQRGRLKKKGSCKATGKMVKCRLVNKRDTEAQKITLSVGSPDEPGEKEGKTAPDDPRQTDRISERDRKARSRRLWGAEGPTYRRYRGKEQVERPKGIPRKNAV